MIVSQKIPQQLMMIRGLGLSLLLLVGWDFAIVLSYKVMHWSWVGSQSLPLASYGVAIGIVVSLRNSSAYARWWEARTLWGAIVNKSRTFARQVVTTMSPKANATAAEQAEAAAEQRQLVLYQVAYVHALSQQLRGRDPWAAVAHLLPDENPAELAREKNLALTLQCRMSAMLIAARDRGWLNQWEWQTIDSSMAGLMDAQGGAERIKNTPMPKQFDFFPMLFVEIYCLMLPVGLVGVLGWFTPLGSTLVGFMFLALMKIGNDLEDPFENTIFDVPVTAIATTVEINLRQLLGETELPSPEQPIRGVLW
ncbi:bestrophin family protein [Acidobacterium sp. S8]|uniref:bestrophin family protein n=1 Tax=Acidobacterium sp. S8 TaxID=1641854 RepID=UPI00131B0274|nr:bestrophin family ion channel [Acidobacterium sp. S8]